MNNTLLDITMSHFGVLGENVFVDFTRYNPNDHVLIIGENQDEAGMDSNGSGKTTFLDAITWTYFGRVPGDNSVDDIIHHDTPGCLNRLRFLDVDQNEIIIQRERTRKGQDLTWFINGKSQARRTPTDTQKALLNYFGILENNKEYFSDFLNTTYFSVEAVKAFAGKESTSKDRMNLISRFLNLEILDRCLSKAKIHANNAESDLEVVRGQIEFLSGKMDKDFDKELLESQINDFSIEIKSFVVENKALRKKLEELQLIKAYQEQFDDNENAIERANSDRVILEEVYLKQQQELQNQLARVNQVKREIDSIQQLLSQSDRTALESHIQKKEDQLEEEFGIIARSSASLESIVHQLSKDPQECPECKIPLMATEGAVWKYDKEELERQKTELQSRIKKAQDTKKGIELELNDLRRELQTISDQERDLKHLQDETSRLKGIPSKLEELEVEKTEKLTASTNHIKDLEKKKISLTLKLKQFPGRDPNLYTDTESSIESNDKIIGNRRDEISRLETRIEAHEREEKELTDLKIKEETSINRYADYQFWVKGFPEIRKWMIEAFLPAFEEQTNSFLDKLEVGMRVRFDTEKEKKKGGTKSQFDLSIIDSKNKKRGLETYSSGEAKRIGICVGFALRELTLNKGYNAFNFLLMDEVVDSLDATGISEFFKLLNSITGLKLLITHDTDLKHHFRHVIKVTRSNNTSTITQT